MTRSVTHTLLRNPPGKTRRNHVPRKSLPHYPRFEEEFHPPPFEFGNTVHAGSQPMVVTYVTTFARARGGFCWLPSVHDSRANPTGLPFRIVNSGFTRACETMQGASYLHRSALTIRAVDLTLEPTEGVVFRCADTFICALFIYSDCETSSDMKSGRRRGGGEVEL